MKTLLLVPVLFLAFNVQARRQVLVGSGELSTVKGIGGETEVGYAFAKGDAVSINATATKKLDRMVVIMYPDVEVAHIALTASPKYSFTMPHDGIIIFRFVSDRGGTNKINYTVNRMPASDAMQNYNTKLVWEKPSGGVPGPLIPHRAED